jgi:hypothetical protein
VDLFSLLTGVAAGLVHVISGPDHLAAVAPLVADDRRPDWRAGFKWGLGHTAGVLTIGALLLLFRTALPIDAISAYSERIVGLSLVAIGFWGITRARRLHVHRHQGGHVHAHEKPAPRVPLATGDHDAQHRSRRLHGHARTHASFAMGLLHGLAGSSHLFGILPAMALPTSLAAVTYLTGFGVGAVAAMTAFAALVGMLARSTRRHSTASFQNLLYACSVAALLVGGVWLSISD